MKYFIHFLHSLIILTYSINLSAQENYSISGIIHDAATNDTLIGVTVLIKATQKGTMTNSKGNFNIRLQPGDYTLVFSYTGYEIKEMKVSVKGNQFITIALQPKLTNIEEVKITSQRKFFGNMEYGREIPTINAKVIENQNSNNASDILHASVAGVWATKTSGSPGDHEKIRIRGQNSFFSSAEPLYVVDGVPVPIVNLSSLGIADLNIHDIENVTVLKDASSTALYGFQGGNGVVLIDTKKGGDNEINFMAKMGISRFDNFYDLMSTKDFLATLQLAHNTIGSFIATNYPDYSDTLKSTNWQKKIFQDGSIKEYQLSGSTKIKNTKIYLSGNYNDQDGNMPNSNYLRYTFSGKLSRIFFKKLALEAGYRGSWQKNKNNQDIYLGNPIIFRGINRSPCMLSGTDISKKAIGSNVFCNYNGIGDNEKLESIISNNTDSLDINSHAFSGSARFQITDHLSFNAMGSLMLRYSNYNYKAYSTIVKSNEEVALYNHQYNISYYNNFGLHKIDVVGAYRFYSDNLWWKVDTMQGYLNTYSYLRNSMAAYGPSGSVIRSINSYVINLSYNYRETYFVSAVTNLSKIKEGAYINFYDLFPSLAVSYDLAQEKPFRGSTLLNNFSIYGNWGKSGNFPLNGLSNDLYQNTTYSYSSETSSYPAIHQLANHHMKQESTEEYDFGIKSVFFNKRLTINPVYYIKNIGNLIMQRAIPEYYGGGSAYVNVGEIRVTGKELSIDATPITTTNFLWHFNFSISSSKQVVKKVLEHTPIFFYNNDDYLIPDFLIAEGKPLGDLYGYKVVGRWTHADDVKESKHFVKIAGMKYVKIDTINGSLNVTDRVVIGNSIPKYNWNFSNTLQYKDFSITMLWYAVQGMQKFNGTRATTYMTGFNRGVNDYIKDSLNTLASGAFYQSSLFVDDASFIRLKTVTFIYEPSKEFFNHIKLKLSVSFENFVTITKYKGYDPEATTFTNNNFSDNAFDRGSVPNPKSVYATISLKF